MAIKKSELYSSLWKGCDELRGGMDASQYKDYVLVLLFVKDERGGAALSSLTTPVLFVAQAFISSSFLSCIIIIPATVVASVFFDMHLAGKGERSALKSLFLFIPMLLPHF